MATEAPNTLISNTRIKILDVVSEGPIAGFWPASGVSGSNPMAATYFDDVPLIEGDGTSNYNISGQGFIFGYTLGQSGQFAITGFDKVEATVPLTYNTRVFNPPPNAGNLKNVVASFNTTQYPDADGVKVTVRIPALFTTDATNGNVNAFGLTYAVDISTNNGPFVLVDTVVIDQKKCTSVYYKTTQYALPKQPAGQTFYAWKLRVRRVSQNVMSANTPNELFVDSVSIVSSNAYSYPMTAMVGIEISADQFASIPSRAYEVKGIMPEVPLGYTPTQYATDGTITPAVYPGVWNGVNGPRQWTDNPAFIFQDLVLNRRYGLGNYIRPEWLDKWTLYQIAQWCDEMVDDGDGGLEPRFTCNVAIQEPQDAYTLLNNLVSVFRGMLYWANGRLFPVGDELRTPVFNFTNANVVGGAFSYSDTPRNTRSTVVTIKWVDPTNLYRTTPERIEDVDSIGRFGYIQKDITAFATTSRGQAIRAANWILTVEQLLTETISFQTNLQGLYLRPGDVFNVYDNLRNNQQQGGLLVDFSTGRNTVVLDKQINLTAGFTYYLSTTVPAANLIATGSITGSDQISLIRNSQIESRKVTTAAGSSLTTLTLDSGFTANLFRGSAWILNASGTNVTVFDQSTQYKVLVTSEPKGGVTDVLGVKYQTGINYLVNNNYSAVVSPPIVGDTTPPLAPTGITVTSITGLLNTNQFYSYLYLSWSGSRSSNASINRVSGQLGAGAPFLIGQPQSTGINFAPTNYGTYTFSAAALNANGYESAYNRTTYVVAQTNPLGPTAPLSGIVISTDYDVYYVNAANGKYTGYVDTTPTFTWDRALSANEEFVPSAQFITGYRGRLLELGNESNILSLSDISLSGASNTSFKLPRGYLYTGVSVRPLRGFTFSIDTVDQFGNVNSGARLAVNNPTPPRPIQSGFVGFNGGVSYSITPDAQADTSGVYIWVNQSPTFTPSFTNQTLFSTNFAGDAAAPQTGSFYTWFAITDSYGPSGSQSAAGDRNSPIYGPMSGNTNAMFGTFFVDITSQLTGAFGFLTGTFTNLQTQVTNSGTQTLLMVNGLSGSVTGAGTAINQALSVQTQQTVTSASGALSTQINAVSARLITTGGINYALAGTVMDALAVSGGAYAAQITQLSATTTGVTATVRLAANATVTGQGANGLGGVALARWGFELDANGKVVSMQATAASWTGNGGYGTIVFGNADLQSNTFSAGSAGWRIRANGDVEFNNAIVRGSFTGGAGSSIVSANSSAFFVGTPGGNRFEVLASESPAGYRSASVYNSSVAVASISVDGGLNQGKVTVAKSDGTITAQMNGLVGNYESLGGSFLARTTSSLTKAYMQGSDGAISGNLLNIGGATIAGGGRATTSLSNMNVELSSGVAGYCSMSAGETPGSDKVFDSYLVIFVNGRSVYVPFSSTLP